MAAGAAHYLVRRQFCAFPLGRGVDAKTIDMKNTRHPTVGFIRIVGEMAAHPPPRFTAAICKTPPLRYAGFLYCKCFPSGEDIKLLANILRFPRGRLFNTNCTVWFTRGHYCRALNREVTSGDFAGNEPAVPDRVNYEDVGVIKGWARTKGC